MNARETTLSGFKVPQHGRQSLFCSVSRCHRFIYIHKSDKDLSIIPLYSTNGHHIMGWISFKLMAAKLLCKLQLSSRLIFLTATLQRLISSAYSVFSPDESVGNNTATENCCQAYKQQDKGGPKIETSICLLCKRAHIARDLLVVCLIPLTPSHSLGVTREQFIKLFLHVIASKSYNLPRQWSSALMGEYIHVLSFAVGPGQSWNACSSSTLGIGPGEIGW